MSHLPATSRLLGFRNRSYIFLEMFTLKYTARAPRMAFASANTSGEITPDNKDTALVATIITPVTTVRLPKVLMTFFIMADIIPRLSLKNNPHV